MKKFLLGIIGFCLCAVCAFITFSQVRHGDIILKNEVVEVKE